MIVLSQPVVTVNKKLLGEVRGTFVEGKFKAKLEV
jgi:hypothetical protein